MYQDFGAAYAIGFLLALLLLGVALAVAVALAVISWRWSRHDRSFVALAFPVLLPLWGIVCGTLLVDVPWWTHYWLGWRHYWLAEPLWVGICTLAAVLIMGRALWLRPAADKLNADVRRRRRGEIAVTAIGAGLLCALWVAPRLRFEYRLAQNEARDAQQRAAVGAAAEAARGAEWSRGRIVGRPRTLCYSPDGKYLVTADEWVQIWDLVTSQ